MTRRGRWRRWLASFLTAVLVGAGILVWQPAWAFTVLGWMFPGIVWRVATTRPLVALSFDDGPAPDHTPAVLEILARHKAHATFFLIGERAAAFPDFVARLRAEGHEVGNHSYTLHGLWRAPDDEFVGNVERTERTLGMRGPLKLFRPPGGRIRRSQIDLAHAHGYRVVLGSAYPYDPAHPPAGYIRWLTSKNLEPGAIVILHDGIADPSRMLSALDGILQAGEKKGLRFVTVGELMDAATVR